MNHHSLLRLQAKQAEHLFHVNALQKPWHRRSACEPFFSLRLTFTAGRNCAADQLFAAFAGGDCANLQFDGRRSLVFHINCKWRGQRKRKKAFC
jgi:hypothetical protein